MNKINKILLNSINKRNKILTSPRRKRIGSKVLSTKQIKAVEFVVGDSVPVKVPKEDRCKASVKQLPAVVVNIR